MVQSPCIQVCILNANKICKGCLRSAQEIADWPDMTDRQKLFVLEDINYDRAFGPMEDF